MAYLKSFVKFNLNFNLLKSIFIIYNFISFFMLIVKCYWSEDANMHNISLYIIIVIQKTFRFYFNFLALQIH